MIEDKVSIGFDSNLIPLILSGRKTLTYRLGTKHASLKVGDTVNIYDSATNEVCALVEITEKAVIPFGDLPVDRKGHEAYPSKEAQHQIFKQYYGKDIEENEPMLVLGFKIVGSGR